MSIFLIDIYVIIFVFTDFIHFIPLIIGVIGGAAVWRLEREFEISD